LQFDITRGCQHFEVGGNRLKRQVGVQLSRGVITDLGNRISPLTTFKTVVVWTELSPMAFSAS